MIFNDTLFGINERSFEVKEGAFIATVFTIVQIMFS